MSVLQPNLLFLSVALIFLILGLNETLTEKNTFKPDVLT